MKKFLLITIIIIFVVLFGLNRFLSLDGTGGQDALITPGVDKKPLALVTGATGKIATELVQLLDKKGYRLILHGRNADKLSALADTVNKPETIIADFTIPEDRAKLIQLISERTPDLVINNAAYVPRGVVQKFTPEQMSQAITIDCIALTEVTIAAVHAMRAKNKRGIVINISSTAGIIAPFPGLAVYGGAKSYVTNFSIAFDYELRGTGIRVLANHPGRVATIEGRDPKERSVISIPEAAQEIYHQIKKRKTNYTFSRYYRVLNTMFDFIPQNIQMWMLGRATQREYGQ